MNIESRRTREKRVRLNEILDAAEKKFAEKGYDHATMDEIAHDADFTKRTVYGYFPGKDELFAAVVCRALSILVEMFDEAGSSENTGFGKVAAIGKAYVCFFETYPRYFSILTLKTQYVNAPGKYSKELKRLDKKMFEIIKRSFEKGRADGTIRKDIDPLMATLHIISASTGLLHLVSRIKDGFRKDLNVATSDIIQYSMGLLGDSISHSAKGESK